MGQETAGEKAVASAESPVILCKHLELDTCGRYVGVRFCSEFTKNCCSVFAWADERLRTAHERLRTAQHKPLNISK